MGYLIIAVIFSTLIFVTFKLFERFRINILSAIVVNYVVATFFGFTFSSEEISILEIPQQSWFLNALVVGVSFIIGFYIFAVSTQKIGVAFSAVVAKISVVIPIAAGLMLYGESLTLLKSFGIIAALIAFYLTLAKHSIFNFDKRYIILPVLLFFTNGLNDSLLKFTNFTHKSSEGSMYFISTIFLAALVVGSIILLFNVIKFKTKITRKDVIAGTLLGLLNFGSTYYIFQGMGMFDSIFFFPVFNVSFVLTSTFVGLLIFKERLKLINWIGIALAVIAILIIAYADLVLDLM
ncbi:MAG: DMT family transporter [Saprospiraceae bacterium]|nr:DMT family transporter [Saprospiraceae bacterium]